MKKESLENDYPRLLEDTPENRGKTTVKIIRFLMKTGALDVFRNSAEKDKKLEETPIEEIEDFLERLNGIISGTPIEDREIYENGGNVVQVGTRRYLHMASVPKMQKKMLEDDVLPAIKKVDKDSRAELSAAAINLLHMFPDGNGRLSRLIYLLLSDKMEGCSDDETVSLIIQALGKGGGNIEFNPQIIYEYLENKIQDSTITGKKEVYTVTGIENLPVDCREEVAYFELGLSTGNAERILVISQILDDPLTAFVASREYLFLKPKMEETLKYLKKGKDERTIVIDGSKLLKDFDDVENVKKWISTYEAVKRWKVRTLVDIYVNPDNHKSPNPEINMKDYFKAEVLRIAEDSLKNEVIV